MTTKMKSSSLPMAKTGSMMLTVSLSNEGILETLKRDTHSAITKIRNDADHMESQRWANEEVTSNKRFNEIHQEIEHTQTKHKAIDLWWTSLQAKEDCEELAQLIEEAKQEC